MKVPYPEHFPIKWVLLFVTVLGVLEIAEGTTPVLALLSSAFWVVGALAFNISGGLNYPSGAYCFFAVILTCGIGIAAKITLGEPLQSNLIDPIKTFSVYLGGACAMYAAAAVNSRIRRRTGIVESFKPDGRINQIALGCFVLGTVPIYFIPGQYVATYIQLNRFCELAIMLPVYYRVKESGGYSSFNLVAFCSWAYLTLFLGLLAFSKGGMFEPSAAWCIAAVAGGYRASPKKLAIIGTVIVLTVAILTPVAQVGRRSRGLSMGDTFVAVFQMLSHPLDVRDEYLSSQDYDIQQAQASFHWFNHAEGLLDRLTMLPIDDALIFATDHGQPGSLINVVSYFSNIIPRYLWPGKPYLRTQNSYAHKIGLLADDDDSTGVSFSPFSEGYHTGRWFGETVVAAGVFLFAFYICDSVSGSLSRSVWGLIYIVVASHLAPEAGLGGAVSMAGIVTAAVITAAIFSTRVAPMIGSMVFVAQRKPTGAMSRT